jgi:hypothetical protein
VRDLPIALKAQTAGLPPMTPSVIRVMSCAEAEISRAIGRDNVTFWGSFPCFTNNLPYLLNPEQAHLGAGAGGILKEPADLDKMVFRDVDEVVAQAREFLKHKGDFAACAVVMLGIDPTWHSMGFETFARHLIKKSELITEVMSRITDWYAKVAEALCALGFDFIWGADDIAYRSGPMFSPRHYRDVLLPHTRKVAEKISLPWIYHSDGNLLPLIEDLLSQGMNAIHPLEPGSMDIAMLKETYGTRVALVGNINPDTLTRGTPEEIDRQVRETIGILGPNYGYLMSSSNTIAPGCKPENVRAMKEAKLKYGAYPMHV